MIVVCGEALIDLVVAAPGAGDGLLAPRPGGGPFNTAVALGRLGVPTAYLGRLSTDAFGRRLRDELASAGTDLRLAASGPEPTPLAIADVSARGEAAYRFYVEGTSDRLLAPSDLPDPLPTDGLAYHFGTLSLVLEPGATTLETLMGRAHDAGRLVALDPNVRPELIADADAYRRRLRGWLTRTDVVRASAADLAWLYPGAPRRDVVDDWRAAGAVIVVITDGAAGATVASPAGVTDVPAPRVEIVDTIGAGDSFNAGLLAWLHEHDRLDRESLQQLDADEVQTAVAFAAHVASITCTHRGADPPWRDEVDR